MCLLDIKLIFVRGWSLGACSGSVEGLPGIAVPPGKAHCPINRDHTQQVICNALGKLKEDKLARTMFGRRLQMQLSCEASCVLNTSSPHPGLLMSVEPFLMVPSKILEMSPYAISFWSFRENCFGNCSLKKSCAPRNNWESISLGWWPAGSWPCTCELKTVPHAILGNVSFLLNSHLISLFQPPLILTW